MLEDSKGSIGIILDKIGDKKYRVLLISNTQEPDTSIDIARQHLEVGSYVKVTYPLTDNLLENVEFYGVITSPVVLTPITKYSQLVLNHLATKRLNIIPQVFQKFIVPLFEIQILDLKQNPSYLEPSVFWRVELLDKDVPIYEEKSNGSQITLGSLKNRTEQKIYLPHNYISKHILVTGTTGSGKTYLLLTLAEKIKEVGYIPVIFDFDGYITQTIRNKSRKENQVMDKFYILAHYFSKLNDYENPVKINFKDPQAQQMIVNAALSVIGDYCKATDTTAFNEIANKCRDNIVELGEKDFFEWLKSCIDDNKADRNKGKLKTNVIQRILNVLNTEVYSEYHDSDLVKELSQVIETNKKIFVLSSLNRLMPLSFALNFLVFLVKLYEIASSNPKNKGIVLLLDEAHYIFDVPSYIRNSIEYEILRIMRIGRRINLFFVMATHALNYIPPEVKNLANTWIALKTIASNMRLEIKRVFPHIDDNMLLYLKPGEALLLNPELQITLVIKVDIPTTFSGYT